MNINPPSEVELMRGLVVIECLKAVGPNGLSPSFFKNGRKVLTPELTKLLISIWAREKIAKEWFESIARMY